MILLEPTYYHIIVQLNSFSLVMCKRFLASMSALLATKQVHTGSSANIAKNIEIFFGVKNIVNFK